MKKENKCNSQNSVELTALQALATSLGCRWVSKIMKKIIISKAHS